MPRPYRPTPASIFAGLFLSIGSVACTTQPAALATIEAREGRLVPLDAEGEVLDPSRLVGAELTVLDPYDQATRVRVDAVARDAPVPAGPLAFYEVSRWDEPAERWVPYCERGPDGLALAMALPGRWHDEGKTFVPDARDFTLTCTGGANGKCARLGFVPGLDTVGGEPLTPYFEACVRMMRADYCGDGRSYTEAGVPVDLIDRAGQQPVWTDDALDFEAVWSAGGAVCVHRVRNPAITLDVLVDACPRLADAVGDDCLEGDLLSEPEARLVNRSATLAVGG